MNVLAKLVTAIKGGVTEVGEAIVDGQAMRILEQEIRDAEEALNQSKDSLAAMIARQKRSEEKSAELAGAIEEHESYAIKALEKGEEELAIDIAEKLTELEEQLNQERNTGNEFAASANRMRDAIARATKDVHYMKQQVDTVKATECVQRAEAAVSERHSGSNSKLRTAMESLERLKEKQALAELQMSAANDLGKNKASLEQRLEEAGITEASNASDVLERLKNRALDKT